MTLSIVIPTYDRPKAISNRVRELLPVLREEIELIIIDNNSTINVEKLIAEQVPESVGHVRHIRNCVNVGANANICKCFEVSDSKWMWLLGDDDEVSPTAVSEIMKELSLLSTNENTVAGFNFSTTIYEYPNRIEISSIEDYWQFISNDKKFSNALLISSCVYNTRIVRQWLKFAYQYCYSCAPHLVLVMFAVLNGHVWVNSPRKVVNWNAPDSDNKWSFVSVTLGLTALLEIKGASDSVRKNLAKGINLVMPKPLLKTGFKIILFDQNYGPAFWESFYLSLSLVLKGKQRLVVIMLAHFSRICWIYPMLRNFLALNFQRFSKAMPNVESGSNRL